MKTKKKGFTLIELLSVIIILAIILAIALPQILNVIENAKKEALLSQSKLYIRSINTEYEVSKMNDNTISLEGICNDIEGVEFVDGKCIYVIRETTTILIKGENKYKNMVVYGNEEDINVYTEEEYNTTYPEIVLNGEEYIEVAQNTSYTDSGATLEGYEIEVTNNVDTSVIGLYTVIYKTTYNEKDLIKYREVRVVEPNELAPSNPGEFTYPNENIEKGSTITVNWGDISSWGYPESGQNYRLEVSYNGSSYSTVATTGTTSSRSHTVSETANTIRYRVRAENSILQSEWVYSNIYDLIFPPITMSNGQLCGNNFTDIRDSKTYETVQIGEQCWFAENLKYTTSTCLNEVWGNASNACRLNDGTGWDQNEVLYQWGTAMNGSLTEGSQGMCPSGWEIPSKTEWETFSNYLNSKYKCNNLDGAIAKSLASNTYWRDNTNECAVGNDLSTNNSSGFNALPVGKRYNTSLFGFLETHTWWWTSTFDGNLYWYMGIFYNSRNFSVGASSSSTSGYSVRCLSN